MKIIRTGDESRTVIFDDGSTVDVTYGWTRLGGFGWMGGIQTFKAIRDAAVAQRKAIEKDAIIAFARAVAS
jgi:hypothetical protein